MNRLLEPSEAFHACLDWQTQFEIDLRERSIPEQAALALDQVYRHVPGLSSRIQRTGAGFAFRDAGSAPITVVDSIVEAVNRLSHVRIDCGAANGGGTRITGRLHHSLGDVTAIMSIADLLIALLHDHAPSDVLSPVYTMQWPVPAERAFNPDQSQESRNEARQFFAAAPPAVLHAAQPRTIRLERSSILAVDAACDRESVSLSALIASSLADSTSTETGEVRIGFPVDCRGFLAHRCDSMLLRALGNCSHGALVEFPMNSEPMSELFARARYCDDRILQSLDNESPAAPFSDGRRYLPDRNPAAQLVVSNARGAARRFEHLGTAHSVRVWPESSIPGLPMVAVNESPTTDAVDVTVIVDAADRGEPLDHMMASLAGLFDRLEHTA